jgi:hypothetical protein
MINIANVNLFSPLFKYQFSETAHLGSLESYSFSELNKILCNWKMSSETINSNNHFIVNWENKTSILEILYDQSGKFISIKNDVWKDLDLNFK